MINKFTNLIKALVTKLWHSIKRFPEAIFMAVALVTVGILLNHYSSAFNNNLLENLHRLAMIFALGIPLYLSVKVFFERIPNLSALYKLCTYAAALIFQVIYFSLLLKNFDFIPVTRYVGISIALYLLFLIIPQIKNKETYELYVISLLYRFIITYLYSAILYAGIMAIITAVRVLFSVTISDKIYLDIFYIIAGIFAPMFFLGDIPESEKKTDIASFPKVFKVLLLYIILPILSIYTLILYAYFIININPLKSPPPNIGIRIGSMLLWYALISAAITFFAYPLRQINKWAKSFMGFYPKLILPLLLILILRISVRIYYYGFTDARYFAAAAGLWVTGSMIYLALKDHARNISLIISMALITAFTVTGFWSSYSVSSASQNHRFETILKQNNMLQNNSIVIPAEEISTGDKENITSIISYFSNTNKLDKVKYLTKSFTFDQMKTVFGFEPTYPQGYYNNGSGYFNLTLSTNSAVSNIKDYDYLIDLSGYSQPSDINYSDGSWIFKYSIDNRKLTILQNSTSVYSRNIDDIALIIQGKNPQNNLLGKEGTTLDKSQMTYTDETDKLTIQYEFYNINGTIDNNSQKPVVQYVQLKVLVKIK